ncbi:MAG: hypothetical protein ACODAU_06875, partial [Myxococcota bacterium]
MADTRACPRCGGPAPPGIKFCGHCGLDLRDAPAEERPAAEEQPAASEEKPPAAARKPQAGRTMIGMPAVSGSGARGGGEAPTPGPRPEQG